MARSQDITPLVVLLLLLTELTTFVQGCHPTSKELHICLNIYLERDFPLIETIIKGQQMPGYGGGRRVLLEGPDLETICRQIGALQTCYDGLVTECNTYWQLGRYHTLMDAFNSSYSYLCNNTRENMRDILLNSACVSRATPYLTECSKSGVHWFISWKQILRMQVDPQDLCTSIEQYKECLSRKLEPFCGKQVVEVYINFLDTWVDSWCAGAVAYRLSGTETSTSCRFTYSCIIMYISLTMAFFEHSL